MRATDMNWSHKFIIFVKLWYKKINLSYIGLKIRRAIDQSGLLLEKNFKLFILIQNYLLSGCLQVRPKRESKTHNKKRSWNSSSWCSWSFIAKQWFYEPIN